MVVVGHLRKATGGLVGIGKDVGQLRPVLALEVTEPLPTLADGAQASRVFLPGVDDDPKVDDQVGQLCHLSADPRLEGGQGGATGQ